jgi:Ca-activated chloride channel homolog
MSKRYGRAAELTFWSLFAALVGIAAWWMLYACGIRIFGYELRFCPDTVEISSGDEQAQIGALIRRVQDLERAIAEGGQCRPEAQLPQRPILANNPPPSPRSDPNACTRAHDEGGLVVVLDGSRSMMLPYDIDPARDRELTEPFNQASITPERRRELEAEYSRALAPPGQQRIDRAREAALEILDRRNASVGAVVFEGCDSIDSALGPNAIERVRRVNPRGGTPIAAALTRAATLIEPGTDGRRTGTIVLVTDGAESCRGDPCSSAKAIKQEHPGIVINVIDVAGWTDIACVARETGGIVRRGGGSIDLKSLTGIAATKKAVDGCEAAIEAKR